MEKKKRQRKKSKERKKTHTHKKKKLQKQKKYGANFTHAHPPTPEKTLLGVEGCIKGGEGAIKFLLRGASKYTPPPTSP